MVCIHCKTYNHERYIEEALKGFVMQKTSFPFVAVVIDDCSIDRTAEIIHKYETSFPDIIKAVYLTENYYSQKKSKQGFLEPYDTQSKYIALCEGDDYWTDPYKLQKQVDYMENNTECGMCFTDFSLQNKDYKLIRQSCFKNGLHRSSSFEDHLITQGYIAPMTWLYRKEELSKLDIPASFIDGSFAFALEFFKKSRVCYLEDDTAVHIFHPDSATHHKDPKKSFNYLYDVFKEQLYFSRKYCGDRMTDRICFSRFLDLLPEAITINNEAFINEASAFFREKGADFADIYQHAVMINDLSRDAQNARNSKAYRLGYRILKPIKRILGK